MSTCTISDICHRILVPSLQSGDVTIDATTGNGHDTLFLARATAPGGQTFAFDIQPRAVETARNLVTGEEPEAHVVFFTCSHTELKQKLQDDVHGNISAAVFNLGYLPHGDKSISTQTVSSLDAIQQAFELLKPLGHLCITAYPGHPGGAEEADAVSNWASALPAKTADAAEYRMSNRGPTAPHLIHVQKSG